MLHEAIDVRLMQGNCRFRFPHRLMMEKESRIPLFDLIHFSEGENKFCAETKQDRAKNFSLGQSERFEVFLHKYRA